MAVIDDLNAAYANVAHQLNAITLNPKPSYTVDGENVMWAEYFQMLTDHLQALKQRIQDEGGPFIITTRGFV